jgi:hypothetical protein
MLVSDRRSVCVALPGLTARVGVPEVLMRTQDKIH